MSSNKLNLISTLATLKPQFDVTPLDESSKFDFKGFNITVAG